MLPKAATIRSFVRVFLFSLFLLSLSCFFFFFDHLYVFLFYLIIFLYVFLIFFFSFVSFFFSSLKCLLRDLFIVLPQNVLFYVVHTCIVLLLYWCQSLLHVNWVSRPIGTDAWRHKSFITDRFHWNICSVYLPFTFSAWLMTVTGKFRSPIGRLTLSTNRQSEFSIHSHESHTKSFNVNRP